MLIGNPERFAFLIEIVPEWISGPFINSLMYVFVNGEIFPKELRVTTVSDDLMLLLDKEAPYGFYCLVNDEKLYAFPDDELFEKLLRLRCPWLFYDEDECDEYDYRFDLDLDELNLAGYHVFAVSNGVNVRILIGYLGDPDSFELVNSVEITVEEFTKIRDEISEYYEKEILQRTGIS